MRQDKGWLQTQMQSAKKEVNDWQSWKRDTLRKEIMARSGDENRGDSVVVRSSVTGRFIVTEVKKRA